MPIQYEQHKELLLHLRSLEKTVSFGGIPQENNCLKDIQGLLINPNDSDKMRTI